ncbi:bifunctional diaminohydroxyphosphoribosylaminopyrimidine deaminase/5-amino-6-(5-phosphoribosylamino)uracil reductase RibD [Oceanicoccus sp. KOV_DT_Chl]|uniref:bifunctional diaminohydroxyphosphoribosylaminopyrimidine deaminase/5-amino-6-(5-phosphoribosylamino)uracil reductase RibD n=1 Tax=Oceanicoccus sp. KOV_DT_Chl TaxID=1904639 RepID=UPI000C7AD987|nr:bifunctional diaminohydroxyphosphoribosylaminopyrimidine deaminase/5-amino-6-(5-phosphoribosylamino)uracil reductase RibD [Oceanicoccus sp. KOV_DT_Chl]
MTDQQYMQLAIDLAQQGLYTTAPNPRVGCVLVKDEKIIGQGYHLRAGAGHAEVNAIADAGHQATGATAYVTLEPCSHTGKTPPCCEALIAAKVARVVIAMTDPNPLVSGRGIAALQQAGITVTTGVLTDQAKALNPGFVKRMESGLPWLRVKMAMSVDGRTAMASGESQWITGTDARSDVQRWRARSCAMISSVDTVMMDNASLTVRADELGINPELALLAAEQQPLRVVLDSQLRLSPQAKILRQPGHTVVVAAVENAAARAALEQAGAEVMIVAGANGRVDLPELLRVLAEGECNEVMVEAGAVLAGAFAQAGLVDQYHIYMAPTFLGSDARPLLDWPLDTMAQQQCLIIDAITPVGNDWRIDARPA